MLEKQEERQPSLFRCLAFLASSPCTQLPSFNETTQKDTRYLPRVPTLDPKLEASYRKKYGSEAPRRAATTSWATRLASPATAREFTSTTITFSLDR